MVDWAKITGFEWDDGNARKSVDKHGVTQQEAEEVFFNEPLLVVDDVKHFQRERRFHALGRTIAGRLLHITFCLRREATKIRVISARPMSRRERKIYHDHAQENS
jgi:uncharacterized DUF497 family protein